MSRFHLFEWEDQSWFPKVFRDFITDHLVFHVRRLYVPIVPMLSDKMRETGYVDIVDLCSGGGGPLQVLAPGCARELKAEVKVTLTDLYPNMEAFKRAQAESNGQIDFRSESVSAMDCPEELQGFRTMFTALHHFRPDDVKSILADAAHKGIPIGIFEFTERNFINATISPVAAFLSSFLITPFLGRRTFSRFLFTYIIPLAPFCFVWDGFVSSLRTYSPKELDEITDSIDCCAYKWESGKVSATGHIGPYNITYLFGIPCDESRSKTEAEVSDSA